MNFVRRINFFINLNNDFMHGHVEKDPSHEFETFSLAVNYYLIHYYKYKCICVFNSVVNNNDIKFNKGVSLNCELFVQFYNISKMENLS